jgi:hypothetical protein
MDDGVVDGGVGVILSRGMRIGVTEGHWKE